MRPKLDGCSALVFLWVSLFLGVFLYGLFVKDEFRWVLLIPPVAVLIIVLFSFARESRKRLRVKQMTVEKIEQLKDNNKADLIAGALMQNKDIAVRQAAIRALIELHEIKHLNSALSYTDASTLSQAMPIFTKPQIEELLKEVNTSALRETLLEAVAGLLTEYFDPKELDKSFVEKRLKANPFDVVAKKIPTDSERILKRFKEMISSKQWEPKDERQKLFFAIAREDWREVARFGHVEWLSLRLQHDPKIATRKQIFEALQSLGEEEAFDAITPALGDKHRDLSEQAAEALIKLDSARAVELLIAMLKEESANHRMVAINALLRTKDDRVMEPLLETLKDSDAGVRSTAVSALAALGDKRAVEPLLEMLKDTKTGVSNSAVRALAEFGDRRAVSSLINALKDPAEVIRESAAYALGKIGDLSAEEALTVALSDSTDVRRAAVEALVQIGAVDAMDALAVLWSGKTRQQALKEEKQDIKAETAVTPQDATTRAINLLVELSTRNDILFPDELLNEAKEHLKAAGEEGSRDLAQLIVELLESRSRKISWAVVAADEAKPTAELLQALRAVMSAEQLKAGTEGRFTPEIFGDGKIGWTDTTHERIKKQTSQALAALKRD